LHGGAKGDGNDLVSGDYGGGCEGGHEGVDGNEGEVCDFLAGWSVNKFSIVEV